MHDFHRPLNVTGYDQNGPVACNLPTVSAAKAYDDAITGESTIFCWFNKQSTFLIYNTSNLLSTMQHRLNDVKINETSRFHTDEPSLLTHSLIIPTDNFADQSIIPPTLHRVASSFPTRKPTIENYEFLPHLCLASEDPPAL